MSRAGVSPRPRRDRDNLRTPTPTTKTTSSSLTSTADYHKTLLDQSRRRPELSTPPSRSQTTPDGRSRRQLTSSSSTRRAGSGGRASKSKTRSRHSPKARQLTLRELEEFDNLPMAVRRKRFSSLERLRYQSLACSDAGSLETATTRRRYDVRLDSVDTSRETQLGWPRELRTKVPGNLVPLPADVLSLSDIPAKVREKHLSREEQLILAWNLGEDVILDAADEAIVRNRQRTTIQLRPPTYSPSHSSTRLSMDSHSSVERSAGQKSTHDSFYDSFRWLEEDEDLDLRLFLDDYHANLREELPIPTKDRRPSFRRHLSITKIPFGRSSVSSSRPGTKDATPAAATTVPPPSAHSSHQHYQRKSRALSLISPRHGQQESINSIDPTAAHYQDPEARLKLRVYLASPQKFDEAIEFGFPSEEVRSTNPNRLSQQVRKAAPGRLLFDDSDRLRTFLTDDKSSTCSDDVSMEDPDSPTTPHTPEKHILGVNHFPVGDTTPYTTKPVDGYSQAPMASREMTLRMTLTRPDLRACEEELYGWRKVPWQAHGRWSPSRVREDVQSNMSPGDNRLPKESMEKFFAGLDHGTSSTEGGVMKRFWSKVRRG